MTHPINPDPAPETPMSDPHSVSVPKSFHQDYLALLEQTRPFRKRAEQLRWSVFDRAAATCERAGLDPSSAGTQLHNCLIDSERGLNWTGVDVSLARRSHELYRRQFDAYRVYERYFQRLELQLRARWNNTLRAA